jgi:uncharacterized protein YjbI with pentapeptide repeats
MAIAEHARVVAQYIADTAPLLAGALRQGLMVKGVMLEPALQEQLRKRWSEARKGFSGPLDLSGLGLSDGILACADLSGSNLANVTFSKLGILHCGLDRCDLRGATFDGCPMRQAFFTDSDLTDAKLTNCELIWCHFVGAKARNVRFDGSKIWLPITKKDGRSANFSGSSFAGCLLNTETGPFGEWWLSDFLSCLDPSQQAQLRKVASFEEKEVKSGCFIATAACGDPAAWEVVALQEFRDGILLHSSFGRLVTRTYYALSPPFAAAICRGPLLRHCALGLIIRPLARLARNALRKDR